MERNNNCTIDYTNSGKLFNDYGYYKSCIQNKENKYYILENGFIKEGSNYYGMTLTACVSKFCSENEIIQKIAPKFEMLKFEKKISIEKTVVYDIKKLEELHSLDLFGGLYLFVIFLMMILAVYSTLKSQKKILKKTQKFQKIKNSEKKRKISKNRKL